MSYLGVGVSPGNVPVYHGSNLKAVDRKVRIAELVLRCLICGFGVLAAVLIGSDTQTKEIFSIRKIAKFTDMKALVFLVVASGLAAAYSLVQVLRCVVSMVRGSVLFHKPLAWAIFSADQFWPKSRTSHCTGSSWLILAMQRREEKRREENEIVAGCNSSAPEKK